MTPATPPVPGRPDEALELAPVDPDPPEPVPQSLVAALATDAYHAPELLVLAAVARLGTRVAARTAWLRETYPRATPAALVRIASREVPRTLALAAVAGATTGPLAPATEALVAGWVQARLYLYVAAAYGRDPADPARAAELLMLLGVYPDVPTARAALDTVRQRLARPEHDQRLGAGPVAARYLRLLAGPARDRRLRRLPARLARGAGAVTGALLIGSTTDRMLRRATSYYRPTEP